jgi:hypothetical protein
VTDPAGARGPVDPEPAAAASPAGAAGPADSSGPQDGSSRPERSAAAADPGFGFRLLPAGWMRGLLFTATVVITVVIALSDVTSAWVVVALPGAVVLAVAYLEALDRVIRPAAAGSAADPATRPSAGVPATADATPHRPTRHGRHERPGRR